MMTHHQMSEAEQYLANEFQLRPREAQVLNMLREAVGYLPRHKISTNNKLAAVHICHLRSKLLPRGLFIDTVRGGYRLSESQCERD